jgi:hypothetical protein
MSRQLIYYQYSTVLFDTGSNFLIIPASNCTTCGSDNRFNSSQSTTFGPEPGILEAFAFGTGVDTLPLVPPAGPTCILVNDTVSLGGHSISQMLFLNCYEYPEFMDGMPPDGILGLSPFQNFALELWRAGQLPSPEYGFYFIPGSPHGGELTLGGTDPNKYEGAIMAVNLNLNASKYEGEWVLDVPAVYFDNKALTNSSNASQPFTNGLAILDTGTPFMMTPDKATAQDLYAQISSEIQPLDDNGSWGAECDILQRVAGDFTFTVGAGDQTLNITVPKQYFSLGEYPGRPGVCQALFEHWTTPFIDTYYGWHPVWLIGSPLLKTYYTVWNGGYYTVGFGTPKKPWIDV